MRESLVGDDVRETGRRQDYLGLLVPGREAMGELIRVI